MSKLRLDAIVQRQTGLSQSLAQGMIHAGRVYSLDGEKLDKPGMALPSDTVVEVREGPRYVSRGGDKLEAALTHFQIDVHGVTAIDVGASTGGFTDCLLQHGAAQVYAVDVGYGQLAWSLRQDPRVVPIERMNIRKLTADRLPTPPAFFTVDCSFISLRTVLPPLMALITETASGVALIKPQFEAGRNEVARGGVVRDEEVHEEVVEDILTAARELDSPGTM